MSLQLAEQYEDNEQYSEAFKEYKKLYDKNPKDLSVLERLGHLATMLKEKDEAADYYSQILEYDATNELAYEQLMDIYVTTDKYKYYVYRGNLHSIQHQLEHAVNDYKKAIANTDDEKLILSARFVLATLYEQTGKNLKAIDEYLKLVECEETHEEVYLKLSNLYLKEGVVGSAVEVLERAIKHDFNTDNVRESLANLYLKNNNPEKALELTKDELMKVKCQLECNQTDKAFDSLKELENKYKNNGLFHSLKAQYYFAKGEFDKAIESVDEFDKFEKNSPLSFQMRALIYENKNDDFNAHLNWGKYNLVRDNKDVAINEFLNAYQMNSTDSNLVNTLAILTEESGDKHHSMEFYEKLAELEPTNKKALEKIAEYRESIGDFKAQAQYLETLYELDKRNAIVVKNLGNAYENLHNKPSAVMFYQKYLEIGKGNPDYEKIKNKLSKLENSNMQEDEGLIDKLMRFFSKK